MLYPYEPAIVVLQTGSNDYLAMSGTYEARVAAVLDAKRTMFEKIHRSLPEAQIVVMSGILMPGRSEYTPIIQDINAGIETLAEELDYVTAKPMTRRCSCLTAFTSLTPLASCGPTTTFARHWRSSSRSTASMTCVDD